MGYSGEIYYMKHLIFAVLLFPAVIIYRTNTDTFLMTNSTIAQTGRDTATIAGKWELLPALASDTATGKIPYINFELETNRFSGNTGCNNMGGNFEIKNDVLLFNENMISTKMACPGYNEQVFFDNLLKTNRYEIKEGVLQLMYNTTILSRWTRHSSTTTTKQI